MSEAAESGITSYCYQVCGSRGSVMCGSGPICQFGIDVETQMPADVQDEPFVGPPELPGLAAVNELKRRAEYLEEHDGLSGIALAGAIRAMVPYWETHARQGAGKPVFLNDLRSLIEVTGFCINMEEFPL